MKRFILIIFFALIIALFFALIIFKREPAVPQKTKDANNYSRYMITITSPAFQNGGIIPEKYGCLGTGINPPLIFADVPANAKSLTLIISDPDAPSGNWIHWLVTDMSTKTAGVAENITPPEAVVLTNSFNQNSYGGPCPPSGTHHYHFRLYALDTALNLNTENSISDWETAADGHIIEQADLIGTYSR